MLLLREVIYGSFDATYLRRKLHTDTHITLMATTVSKQTENRGFELCRENVFLRLRREREKEKKKKEKKEKKEKKKGVDHLLL